MTTDETIQQVIRRLIVEDGLDVDVATDKAISSVSRAKLAEFVRPVVAAEARRVARWSARRIEDAAFSHPPAGEAATPNRASPGGGVTRLTAGEARKALVASRFVTPEGNWVTWGAATAEDHRARAEWQRGHASACARDAARHEQAAALIAERGVSCLDDIDGWTDLLQDAA